MIVSSDDTKATVMPTRGEASAMISVPPHDPASQGLHEGGPTGWRQEGGAGGQGEQEVEYHQLGRREEDLKKS